jgi:Serine/Threonine/Tyrosine Kinase found in polyvalent proteins
MLDNGFENNKNNDYINIELGIILEDLHDENVLTFDGNLFFIDTVFYLKNNFFI